MEYNKLKNNVLNDIYQTEELRRNSKRYHELIKLIVQSKGDIIDKLITNGSISKCIDCGRFHNSKWVNSYMYLVNPRCIGCYNERNN